MAVGQEIRTQIASISSTRKITRAMEMVAASKMRQAQEKMARGKPYARHLRKMVAHIASGNLEFQHDYFQEREIRQCGYIIISTDRGLCGGLNINLFKTALQHMRELSESGVGIRLCLIGNKGEAFFKSLGGNIIAAVKNPGENASATDLIGLIKVMLDQFEAQEIDRLFLVSNDFHNTMTQNPGVNQLLPLVADPSEQLQHRWDYIYEPDDAQQLLGGLMVRYIESLVYQAVVENNACEQAARMVAMKSATENAGNLIDELQLAYNKARQAAITQELSEIVGGAAAV